MDLVTILATAAGADPGEHSETLFLVVGGALAVFAIAVGALGLARPNLGTRAANIIMGVGSVLVVGTMVSMIAVS